MLERIKKINFSQIDYVILFCMTVLIGVGLYSIYQSDVHKAKPSSLFTSQVLGIGLGLGVFIVLLFIDYQFICKFAWLYYIGINGLLLLTLRSKPINYVRRWITLGEIQFQTSELAKVVMIIVISYLCNKLKNRMNKFYVFFILCAVMVIPIVLILKEPHLSSTVAFFVIFCVMLFSAGLSYKIIITMALIVTIGFGGIFFGVTKLKLNIPFIKDYMIGRIENFLASDSEENKDAKRQTNKAVVAIHSGGAYGKMLDPKEKDTDRKYGNIYANESDFIFSVVGEEFGFIGCTIILFMYLLLILRCLNIAAHAPDYLGRMICIGVSSLFLFQTFVNVGVATDLLPNTGQPLPFISYGMTSLISSIVSVGFVINVGMRRRGREYKEN